MNVGVKRRGPASKYTIWARCRDPLRWGEWMPLVHDVDVSDALRPGLEGQIVAAGGFRIRFLVLDVDERAGRWTWLVRSGPIRLRIEHEVDEGIARVVVSGALPVALSFVPLAERGLTKLVSN